MNTLLGIVFSVVMHARKRDELMVQKWQLRYIKHHARFKDVTACCDGSLQCLEALQESDVTFSTVVHAPSEHTYRYGLRQK